MKGREGDPGRGRAWSEGGNGGGQRGREIKEGRQIGGEQGVREGVKEELLMEGRDERNEGGGRYGGGHGVREGVKEDRGGREGRHEGGEAGRRRAWREGE